MQSPAKGCCKGPVIHQEVKDGTGDRPTEDRGFNCVSCFVSICQQVHRHSHSCSLLNCRANFRVLSLIVSISGLAAFNAMYVPLRLEQAIHSHPRSTALLAAARAPDWPATLNTTSAG